MFPTGIALACYDNSDSSRDLLLHSPHHKLRRAGWQVSMKTPNLSRTILLLLGFLIHPPFAMAAESSAIKIPRVLDARLKLDLFASEPEIVTPTGIATDAKGRVLAIE